MKLKNTKSIIKNILEIEDVITSVMATLSKEQEKLIVASHKLDKCAEVLEAIDGFYEIKNKHH